jgi:hypothetical protein
MLGWALAEQADTQGLGPITSRVYGYRPHLFGPFNVDGHPKHARFGELFYERSLGCPEKIFYVDDFVRDPTVRPVYRKKYAFTCTGHVFDMVQRNGTYYRLVGNIKHLQIVFLLFWLWHWFVLRS